MAKNNNIDAMIGMWMASAVLMPIGVFLTYKSTRDSKLFSMSNYMGGIRKIGSIFKRSSNEDIANLSAPSASPH